MNCENSHLYILFFNQETIYMAKQSPVSNLWPSNPRPPHLFKSKQLYFNLFYILGFCTRALLKNMNLQLKSSLNTALEISEIIERSKQTPKSSVFETPFCSLPPRASFFPQAPTLMKLQTKFT